jgi:hypothetical protein
MQGHPGRRHRCRISFGGSAPRPTDFRRSTAGGFALVSPSPAKFSFAKSLHFIGLTTASSANEETAFGSVGSAVWISLFLLGNLGIGV